MKFLGTLVIILGLLSSTIVAQQSDFYKQLRFEVTAQKDITPNAIEVILQLQKKGPNMEEASEKLERTLQRLQQECKAFQLSENDISIQSNLIDTVDWLFGKDFHTDTTIKIKVKALKNWAKLTKQVLKIDSDLKFYTVTYSYPNDNQGWDTLLQEAIQTVQARKKQYERQFGVTLTLVSLQERRFKTNNGPIPMARKMMMAVADAQGTPVEEPSPLGLPVSPYQLTLEVGYSIKP